MDPAFQLADVSAAQLVLIGAAALGGSVLGGLAGYGTGLVVPIFLAPVVGVANVVPVMAVGMIFANGSRAMAFWRDIHWPHARRVLLFGLPACVAGAYSYTLLEARWVALLLGGFFVASVPLRRALARSGWALGTRGVAAAGAGFGYLNGTMTGVGMLLISLLMAAGLQGAAVIGTDAIISVIMGFAKIALFGGVARLDAELALAGVLIGLCTAPGGFIARRLLARIPLKVHTAFMDAIVLAGGASFLWRGLA
ncbi:MAG: sulfite exporter TauE/SafE family protein [Betaproteobacteria bacterium]|nr:sulfite exporter TauE/SafE family protein [Betaproteobacteria bacterium]MDH5222053.1 sulfite exporter TauE/SafE family protein [Betaproteobacteria bacterium]MDH5352441.1 sulfite exporter TauE/SafE family protein [Betaproteobacteria bacterium]